MPVKKDRRRGLNCTLTYKREEETRGYRIRVSALTFGYEMLADESQARQRKAFYPRRTAPNQFAITADFVGYRERRSFVSWMLGYAEYILDPTVPSRYTPVMTVRIPARHFIRVGVPVSGYDFGDHLGSMVFSPQIVFETAREPVDWEQTFDYSRVLAHLARVQSPETEYFYPTGTHLSGEETPPAGTYATIQAAATGDKNPNGKGGGGKKDDGEIDYHDPANQIDYINPYGNWLDPNTWDTD